MRLWPRKWRRVKPGRATKSNVVAAYNTILGRPPESEVVIDAKLSHANIWDLIRTLTNSAEFKQRLKSQSSDYYHLAWRRLAPPLAIDCGIQTDEAYARLENRIRQTWERLGTEEPYFSVITDQRFLMRERAPDRQAFYDLGKGDAELVLSMLARAQVDSRKLRTCVEYGCGVGRATWQLASLFDKVIAVDLSTSHIDIARKWISDSGIRNVEFIKINNVTNIYKEDYDFWFSRIVLQHNPPPIIVRILMEAFRHLRPGGIALFQVPTYIKGYTFNLEEYLGTFGGEGQMEMHCIPQRTLINTIIAADCEIIEIIEDQDVGSTQTMISNTFLVRKDRPTDHPQSSNRSADQSIL